MSLKLILSMFVVCVVFFACKKTDAVADECTVKIKSKINGVSFVAPVNEINQESMIPIQKINANWVTLMPYGFTNVGDSTVRYNIDHMWWGETKEGIEKCIKLAHNSNLKVLIKPHIWTKGMFTGDLVFNKESTWQFYENQYREYILFFAKIAESLNVEMFSVGTEFRDFVVARPDFWSSLIKEVRAIYKGKVTYAANWDAIEKIPFWKELDYIGIDAYFPLSDEKTPSFDSLNKAWEIKWFDIIKGLSEQNEKEVLFTEFGYRSLDFTCKTPWDSGVEGEVNMKAQSNAYSAIYETFWTQEWFAGGFLWKWYDYHDTAGGAINNKYTPQNKPVESIISANNKKYQ